MTQPADRVRTALREAQALSGTFLVAAAIGTGMAAQAAARGGADFLVALNAGQLRSMGEPSVASLLALRDTNRFVMEFAKAEIRPRTRTASVHRLGRVRSQAGYGRYAASGARCRF